MGETEEFNTLAFEKKLMQLKDTQESIQGLSSWCLKQRDHHKKIVLSWLNVLKRVKVEQRLVLFYLANDVIQYSKRKNYEFVESWGLNLQKATPLVRDDKVRPKILRIFKIWEQRSVYDDEFLSDLTGLLSAGAVKKADDDPLDFQPQQLVNKIKQCAVLEADTDMRLKYIHESHLQLSDADALLTNLKDRSHKDDVEKELNEGIACVERYTQALQREIVAREALLALLTSANQYYSTQRGEVKVVAYAYKNFGARVRALKRKLDDLIPTLPSAAPSPPERDEDVPSPGPDEDLDLPVPENETEDDIGYNIDQTFNTSLAADGSLYNFGLSSFLTSDNALSLFNESTENANISVTSGTMSQKSQDALPGLDLLTPESTGNPPPPTSFYGTMESLNDDTDQPYHPEETSPWNNSAWSVPQGVPPPTVTPHVTSHVPTHVPSNVPAHVPSVFVDAPASPPPVLHRVIPPTTVYSQQDPPAADVDHRGILPPPPPPPVLPLLGNIEDVDHRMLPSLGSMPPAPLNSSTPRHTVNLDVDHRNLISLTHQQPAPVLSLPITPISIDQDYRVPPMVPPPDIVESVDMDLSEDEDQRMYQNPSMEHSRRPSFNNNKVLVGGDNGKVTHEQNNTNLIQINNKELTPPQSAPIILPMVNPFDAMPPALKKFNQFQTFQCEESKEENSNEITYQEDSRRDRPLQKQLSQNDIDSLTSDDFEWSNQSRPMNHRFPRNWNPRTFRPPGFSPPFWPRNGPRPPPNRWLGPRPQRFW